VIDGIGSIGAAGVPASAGRARPADGFDSIFRRELVKFSKHAEERLQRDGIQLTDAEKERLDLGMDKAAAKGARSSRPPDGRQSVHCQRPGKNCDHVHDAGPSAR
jgi:hypothetical protein